MKILNNTAAGLAEAPRAARATTRPCRATSALKSLQRDAQEEGRSADIPESVFEKVFAVGSALIMLAPYYEEEKLPPDAEESKK